jgi:hypothetical protein
MALGHHPPCASELSEARVSRETPLVAPRGHRFPRSTVGATYDPPAYNRIGAPSRPPSPAQAKKNPWPSKTL